MIITRRSLMLSAAGAAIMARGATFSRKARAATNPGGRDAVTFNKTWLTNPGLPGMPVGLQQQGVFSVDWRVITLPPLNSLGVIVQNNVTTSNFFGIGLSNLTGTPTIQLSITGADGSNTFYAWYVRQTLDSLWHRDTFAWDTGAQTVKWLADGITVNPYTAFTGSAWAVNPAGLWNVGAAGRVGKTVANPLIADVADLTLWMGGYADPTDLAVMPAFYDAANEVPLRLGPVAWATLDPLRPQICLSGPASQFMQNLTAGEFEPLGNAPKYYDTTPTSMFTLAAGNNLVTAASDPWSDPA